MGVDVNLILLDEEEYKRLETKAARFYGESFYDHAASEKCFDFGRARDTLPNSETRVCDALIELELSGKKAIDVLETLQLLHSYVCSLDSWGRSSLIISTHNYPYITVCPSLQEVDQQNPSTVAANQGRF